MISRSYIALAAALLTSAAVAPQASASAIVLGTGYSIATTSRIPEVGEPLRLVGQVASLNAPIDAVGVVGKMAELTYVFEGFQCTMRGIWQGGTSQPGDWFAQYASGGVLRIYGDDTPDMDIMNPSSYSDGLLLLEARFSSLVLGGVPSQYGSLQFTGGALFDQVSSRGVGLHASHEGTFSFYIPIPMEQLGYGGEATTSHIDLLAPTPVEARSWGSVKALYFPWR